MLIEDNIIMNKINTNKASVEVFELKAGAGVAEYHLMVHVCDPTLTYQQQVNALLDAYDAAMRQIPGAVAVFKRYFLSDAANQADLLLAMATEGTECAMSLVQQPPLDGTKIALWAYLLQGDVQTKALPSGLFEVAHGGFRHLWTGGNTNQAANSEYQTRLLLNDYVMNLAQEGCTLSEHCVRTWFFVQDIDNKYAGMVKARNDVFVTQGLTDKTHFIASTGIGGRMPNPASFVQMDAYAVKGLQPGQMRYLYATDYLNRTSEYGVSFERGTMVDYGDRRQVFISGTASINNKGEIMYHRDIRNQTHRMWENVEALLHEADCSFNEVGQMIVYLRDIADYYVVKSLFDERFPDKPKVFVNAPVCRPGWLIEMECMAVKTQTNTALPVF